MNGWIADPNSVEDLTRMFLAALLDRFQHGPADKVVFRFDVDCDDTTFVFGFKLRF